MGPKICQMSGNFDICQKFLEIANYGIHPRALLFSPRRGEHEGEIGGRGRATPGGPEIGQNDPKTTPEMLEISNFENGTPVSDGHRPVGASTMVHLGGGVNALHSYIDMHVI